MRLGLRLAGKVPVDAGKRGKQCSKTVEVEKWKSGNGGNGNGNSHGIHEIVPERSELAECDGNADVSDRI
jgi:hypothetical protein